MRDHATLLDIQEAVGNFLPDFYEIWKKGGAVCPPGPSTYL